MTKLHRVIERFTIVGVGPLLQQPSTKDHVVCMTNRPVKHRELVIIVWCHRHRFVHTRPMRDEQCGDGQHL
mgnify:CR=1 FL=1